MAITIKDVLFKKIKNKALGTQIGTILTQSTAEEYLEDYSLDEYLESKAYYKLISSLDIDWGSIEIDENITIEDTADLINWIKSLPTKGQKGDTGEQGPTGPQGPKGETGDPGEFDDSEFASEEESVSYDYIYDETSWNESFANGALKKYYEKYPDEDRYNQQAHRWAWAIDKVNGEWPEYCVQCWEGAVSADGAKYPWICPNFDTDVNSKIRFEYEGKESVMPWNNTIFGTSEGHKAWGIASVAEEFKDRGFLIPEHVGNEPVDSDWTGETGANNFDISKFKMILVRDRSVKEYIDEKILAAEIESGAVPGPQGERGAQGPKGDKGDTGETGP